jgi:hypothetical protein
VTNHINKSDTNQSPSTSEESKKEQQNTYFSKRPAEYYYTYDTLKSQIENFDSGYVDTFSVDDVKFKLFSNPDTSGDLELQVLKNGQWVTNLKTPYGINGNEADIDFNNDGFIDFTVSMLRGSGTYLFDTTNKLFNSEAISHAFEYKLIELERKIYADIYERDLWETYIFSLKGFKQQYLYCARLEMINKDKETARIKLYKYNTKGDEVFIEQKIIKKVYDNFDYEIFWKEFLKGKPYR